MNKYDCLSISPLKVLVVTIVPLSDGTDRQC